MADATAPRFTPQQVARIQAIKSALRTGAGGATGRLRTELHGLYKGASAAPVDPIQQQASQAADIKYGPAQQSIAGEQRVSDQMQQNIPNWYDTYLNQVQAARDATAQAYQSAEQRVRDAATASTTQATGQNADLQKQMEADAARRGATLDPSTFATANQAAQSRQGSQNSFAGLLGSQGATATTALDTRKTIGAGEKVAQQVLETRRRGSIDQRLSSLLTEKGQYQNQQVAAIKDALQKAKLENLVFNNTQANTKSEIASRRSAASLGKQKFNSAAEKDKYQRAHGLGPYKPAAGGKGKKPTTGLGSLSQPQETKIVSEVNRAKALIQQLRGMHLPGLDDTGIRQKLAAGGPVGSGPGKQTISPINADLINAAYDLVVHGYLSTPNINALHSMGIHIPPKWQKPKGAPNFQGVSGSG